MSISKAEESKNLNSPFLLKPAVKDYLWGGSRLNDDFNLGYDIAPFAEAWVCSCHPDGESVADTYGLTLAELLRIHPEWLGTHASSVANGEFPILIKFIDAKANLSVQVHPSDEYAREYENGQLGKTEMWYVLDAIKDSRLIYGLKYDCSKEAIRDAIEKGELERHLRYYPIKKNDVFFIEAGTIHAIGAGALIAEIQENSNLTYRLYDYDRVDKTGKKRELHVDKALEVSNLKNIGEPRQAMRVLKYIPGVANELLSRCKYFEVYRMLINTERRQKVTYSSDELSFRVLLCYDGCGNISYCTEDGRKEYINIYKGDCVFVPADSVELVLNGVMELLDVRC